MQNSFRGHLEDMMGSAPPEVVEEIFRIMNE
jgi:hypothetical protein